MAELDELQWEIDGLLLGDDTPYPVLDTKGLEDSATFAVDSTDRGTDGVVAGRQRLKDRQVELTIGFHGLTSAEVEEAVDALREKLSPQASRLGPGSRVLRWRHRGVTKRVTYTPGAGASLRLPAGWRELVVDHIEATATMWCPDPVVYSDAFTATAVSASSGSPDVIEVTNAGTLTAVSPGCMWWELTGGGSGYTGAYLEHVDFPGERWQLTDVAGAASVTTVDRARVTRRGGVLRSASVKGPNGLPIPVWPALRPGVNQLRFGCTAGSFTGTFWHRSTW